MKKLKELTEQATQVVTRNSANLGQDVDSLKQQIATVTGRVDVNESTLTVGGLGVWAIAKLVHQQTVADVAFHMAESVASASARCAARVSSIDAAR